METRARIEPDEELDKKIEALKKKSASDPNIFFEYLLKAIKKNKTHKVKRVLSEQIHMELQQIKTLMLLSIQKKNFEALVAIGNYLKSTENLLIESNRDYVNSIIQSEVKENIFGKKNSLFKAASQQSLPFLKYLLENQLINFAALGELEEIIGKSTLSIETTDYILSCAFKYEMVTIHDQPFIDHILNELLKDIVSKKSLVVNETTLEKLFLLFERYHAKPSSIPTPRVKKLIAFLNTYKQAAITRKDAVQCGRIAYIQAKLVRARTSLQNAVPKTNEIEAEPYVREAAEKNWPDACLEWGLKQLQQKNYVAALDYFDKAYKNSKLTKEEKAIFIIDEMARPLTLDLKKSNEVVRSTQFISYFTDYIGARLKKISDLKEDANTISVMAHWIPLNKDHVMDALKIAHRGFYIAVKEKDIKTETQASDDIYTHFLPEIIKHKKITSDIDFIIDEKETIQLKWIELIAETLQKDNKEDDAALFCDIAVMLPGLVDFALGLIETRPHSAAVTFLNYLRTNQSKYVDYLSTEHLVILGDKQPSVLTVREGPALFAPKSTSLPKTNNYRDALEAFFILSLEEKKQVNLDVLEGIKRNILDAYQKEGEPEMNIERAQMALKQIAASSGLQERGQSNDIIKGILEKIGLWMTETSVIIKQKHRA